MNGSASAPKLSHDEWNPLGHQAGNERHVAREPIELGNQHRTFPLARSGRRLYFAVKYSVLL
jgi:hypothetical protein